MVYLDLCDGVCGCYAEYFLSVICKVRVDSVEFLAEVE